MDPCNHQKEETSCILPYIATITLATTCVVIATITMVTITIAITVTIYNHHSNNYQRNITVNTVTIIPIVVLRLKLIVCSIMFSILLQTLFNKTLITQFSDFHNSKHTYLFHHLTNLLHSWNNLYIKHLADLRYCKFTYHNT